MKITSRSTLREIAFLICTEMGNSGVTAVLCGGGAAALYAPRAYRTRDLDFVLQLTFSSAKIEPIANIGYIPSKSRGIYEHPDSPYTLEFMRGPLAVADEELSGYETLREGDLYLHVISPTDCVRDRLAAGIHWNDPNAAKQAAAVANCQSIDLELVKAWCGSQHPTKGERVHNLFQAFLKRQANG